MVPSSRLLINRIKHFVYRVAGKKFLVARCEPYDIRVKFAIADGLGRDIYYKYGVYSEDHITRFLLEQISLEPGDLVIDIGANIGWYSLVLGHNRKVDILAFEPDPSNFNLLKENLVLNGCSTVRAFNKAISDEDGVMQLHLYKSYNTGRHSFIRQKNSIGTVDVPVVNLDSFLEGEKLQNRPVKLLKIDIEGYEYTALRSANQTLERTRHILTEFSPDLMKVAGQDPGAYIRLLEDAGFHLSVITPEGLITPDFDTIIRKDTQVNLWGSRA